MRSGIVCETCGTELTYLTDPKPNRLGQYAGYCPNCQHVVLSKPGGRNKYGARKVEVDGFLFDSKAEANRWMELVLLEKAGEISQLERQPRFQLVIDGIKIGRYTADFRYTENGKEVIEDVKSRATLKTEAYRLRKKVFEAIYKTSIREVVR